MKKLFLLLVAFFFATGTQAQWTPSLSQSVKCFYKYGYPNSIIYAGAVSGVYRTSNEGVTWRKIDKDSVPFVVNAITSVSPNGVATLLAGTSNGLFKALASNDSAWTRAGLTGKNILSLGTCGISGSLFAGTTNGVYRSTDNGTTWDPVAQLGGRRINWVDGILRWLGTDQGLYKTTDNGGTWVVDSVIGATYNVNCIKFVSNSVLVGHATGYLYTTNGGVNWYSGGTLPPVYSVDKMSTNTVLMGYGNGTANHNGVWLATLDNTVHTVAKNSGLPNTEPIYAVQSQGNTNYVLAASSQQVYKAPVAYVPVTTISTETPDKYEVSQNYPNPFNPSTTIKYSIVSSIHVDLIVYDVTGREITRLVNENQSPGTYEITWAPAELTSGIYFYKLQAGAYSDIKRMILIK